MVTVLCHACVRSHLPAAMYYHVKAGLPFENVLSTDKACSTHKACVTPALSAHSGAWKQLNIVTFSNIFTTRPYCCAGGIPLPVQ